jgi:hypothetical protein
MLRTSSSGTSCLIQLLTLEMPVPSQGHYVFTVFRLLTDFVCLYNYEFWLSLCKIVRSSVILLLPLFIVFVAIFPVLFSFLTYHRVVTRLTRRVPLVELELLLLSEHLRSSPVSRGVGVTPYLVICVFLCRSLFVLLYCFFWPLCCLFFFDIRILITPLLSSKSSYRYY